MPSMSKEYQKNYYLANKEKIIEQVKVKGNIEVECEVCKRMVKKSNLNSHKQTKIHKYIEQQNNNNNNNNVEQ